MIMEIWKDVVGYEGLYKVSNKDRVKSFKFNKGTGKALALSLDGSGYYKVRLYKNGKNKTKRIHQLVAIAFLGHVPDGMNLVINHKNFNKLDNRPSNLEIVTQRENANKKHLKFSSKYTGVSAYKSKWRAQIVVKNKTTHLGLFKTESEAHLAYESAKKGY